jgi:TetR/AcrR family transcriptional regulator, tetracycline repressor protein
VRDGGRDDMRGGGHGGTAATFPMYSRRMARAGAAKQQREQPLTRLEIVEAALALADGEGLDAVTIRRVATDRGVTHMALYWHFRSKEELLDAIAEHLFAQVELPASADGSGDPWDRRLLSALSAIVAVLRPHPGAARLAPARITSCDAGLRLTDHVLGILREAGFPARRSAAIATQLLVSVIALVTGHPGPSPERDPEGYAAALRTRTSALTALDPARFPHVSDMAAELAECADDDGYYGAGLELLTGGVRALAAQLPRP